MSEYAFPLPKGEGYTWKRIDQGQDFQTPPGSAVLALGDGIVSTPGHDPGGFGERYPVLELESGPWRGRKIYYGHVPAERTGEVRAGDVIAHTSRVGVNAPPGWAEIGFFPPSRNPGGSAIAPELHRLEHSAGPGAHHYSGDLYGEQAAEFIARGAYRRHLDPGSTLSVVVHEGSFEGAVGDSGTSYGPFQLHEGGQLPAGLSDPKRWANSPAGLNFALDHLRPYAAGLPGGAASIEGIVRDFEAPQDPQAEITAAESTYQQAQKAGALPPHPPSGGGQLISDWSVPGSVWSFFTNAGGNQQNSFPPDLHASDPNTCTLTKQQMQDIVNAVADGTISSSDGNKLLGPCGPIKGPSFGGLLPESIGNFFEKAAWPFTHPLRAGEVVGGGLIAFIGLIMLARVVGHPLPGPAVIVEAAAKVGEATGTVVR